MRKYVLSNIRHHPLTQPVDGVEPGRACNREQHADREQHGEILVDECRVIAGKTVIDHTPHSKR